MEGPQQATERCHGQHEDTELRVCAVAGDRLVARTLQGSE